ncbi:outer membrane protein OmpA-like peptidoglycan-associated protein [Chitinivorax tropicus]|uniref:Outer membrane protein OmpA-like peptidoglycan-associated protein n=1 Tax=Chitinivorax tropicus TaxID=714531 RepID=A0A840MTP9_9PROT|nr:OmpA family protein [Chitinivorax tropicus]MBB5019746.1 outer membrane protein OmpA-like peptidoglycan-associated protein [Chitinivorax tropicus]
MKLRTTLTAALIITLGLSACATDEYGRSRPLTNAETGAIIGVVGGAVAGAAIHHKNRGKGALIGAIGGGIAGGLVGNYMDSQAKDLNRVLASEVQQGNIQITKVGEHNLRITMTNTTAFATNSYAIKPGFLPTMDKIAKVLNTYGKTTLEIEGHTDNVGSDASNQTLSENRANAVEEYLLNRQVAPERLRAYGRGETQPRASNDNEAGRALNRRVEILIEPVIQG